MASVSADNADAVKPVDLATSAPFELGGLRVRPATREIGAGEASEILEPRVMQVLVALAEERERVVSRERLIERCWGGRIISEDAINTCIVKVRRVGEAHRAFTIQTVPRVGYRLAAEGPAHAVAPPRPRSIAGLSAAAAALILLVAGLGAAAYWAFRAPPPFTVAVAPFEATPGDPAAATLAKHVDDTLTGAMTARHVDVSPSGANRAAAILVRGSVEARGDRASVRVTLEDRRANLVVWQGQFDGAGGFDSSLPDQVSTKATSMVTTARELYDSSGGKAKPRVLKAYVLGMENFRERHNMTEHLSFMRTMRQMAPEIPAVQAIYAQTLVSAADEQPQMVKQSWRKEAMAAADQAIRGDRTVGLAYAAKSNAMEPTAFAERLATLERGLRYAPLDGHLSSFYGRLKSDVGRPLEGMPFTRRGHLTDPDAAPRTYAEVDQLIAAGMPQEAMQALQQARRVTPQNYRNPLSLTLLAVASQAPDEGKATMEDVRAAYPDAVAADLWLEFFDSLRCHCHGEATAAHIEAAALAGRAPVEVSYLALSRLGELDQALAVANLVRYGQASNSYGMLFAPATAPMRRDRRFMDVAARLGLAQYWRTSNRWPEFCAEQTLPYDCKVEAARALGAAKAG